MKIPKKFETQLECFTQLHAHVLKSINKHLSLWRDFVPDEEKSFVPTNLQSDDFVSVSVEEILEEDQEMYLPYVKVMYMDYSLSSGNELNEIHIPVLFCVDRKAYLKRDKQKKKEQAERDKVLKKKQELDQEKFELQEYHRLKNKLEKEGRL